MNKTNINTSWLRRGAWGTVVLLLGLLLGSCEPAGPTGETPGDGNGPEGGPEEPVLKTLPAECLTVEANGEITAFDDKKQGCALTEFAIPSEKDGTKITVIGDNAFDGRVISMKLTKLSIPDSVETIGNHAFRNNDIKSVTIPKSVTTIGEYAFWNNKLESLTIGDKVTSIGISAFQNNGIISLTIPNSVTTIGASAFSNNQLTSLTIGSKVNMIGTSAFAYNNLTSLTIGNSVETIGNHAFRNNDIKSVTIPKSVTSIGASAFYNNLNLKTVILELRTEVLTIAPTSFLGDLKKPYEAQTPAEQLKAGTWTYAVTADLNDDPTAKSWTFKAAATP